MSSFTVQEQLHEAQQGRIQGQRCGGCGHPQFTLAVRCAQCGSPNLTLQNFSPKGTVVSFTVVEVPVELFRAEVPYGFVIVQLDDGPRIAGWMPSVRSAQDIRIGDSVRLTPSSRPTIQFEKL